MFKTLYYKLAIVLVALFCLIGVLYIQLTLYTTRLYFQEVNQKLNRTLAYNLAAEKVLMKDGRVDIHFPHPILSSPFFSQTSPSLLSLAFAMNISQ